MNKIVTPGTRTAGLFAVHFLPCVVFLSAVFFPSCEEYTLPKYGNYITQNQIQEEDWPEDGQFVSIKFNIPGGTYSMTVGNKLELEAAVKGDLVRDPVYAWKLNNKELSGSLDLVFDAAAAGVYDLVFSVTAENGSAEKIFRLMVQEKPQANTLLYFDYGKFRNEFTPPVGTYTVPKGRHLIISPVRHFRQLTDSTTYEWALDGVIQRQEALPPYTLFPSYFNFDSSAYEVGDVPTVTVYARDRNRYGTFQASAETRIKIVEPEGTFKRPAGASSKALADRVLEFTPAPGQHISDYGTDPWVKVAVRPGATEEQIREETEAFMKSPLFADDPAQWTMTLGSWGGYLVTGFDHSIDNRHGEYSFSVEGNSFTGVFAWHEPGTAWVSQDENGDGLANDTWFELRASETGKEATIQLYSVKYYKRESPIGARWEDNNGNGGFVPYSIAGAIIGWPWHTGGDYVIFTGTALPSHLFIQGSGGGAAGLVHYMPFPYGYADNGPQMGTLKGGFRSITHFRISDAMHVDGTPANLAYIDFVKIQSAEFAWSNTLGESSTETGFPTDYAMIHGIK
jgi:hypothetical protein